MTRVWVCALVTMVGLIGIFDAKPIRLTVTPAVSFAPAQLQIQVRLQPDDTDRWISVGMDNGEYRRTSGFTIEPDRHLYTVSWRGIPPGDYDVLAAVGHQDRTRATDRARVIVAGP